MEEGTNRAAELLQQTFASGELSKESSQALIAAGDVGREIGRALGSSSGQRDELLLVTILVDDSSSILSITGGTDAVCQGHNHCLDALDAEKGAEILVHTRHLNSGSLSPYRTLSNAVRLNVESFNPAGQTPLYRQSILTLGAVMAKVQEQKAEGRCVRAFTLIITDGGDNASGQVTAHHVNFLVRDMLDFSDDYIVAGMGIGQHATFQPIFRAMGIPEGWILTADAEPEEISKLFRKIAQSLQLAASGEAGWLQLEAGPVQGD